MLVPDELLRARFARVAAHAFGFPVEEAPDWFALAGHENLRVVTEGERVLGGLIVIPQGQFFGGRSVPSLGLAGVAVGPDARGAGVATRLVIDTLREARQNGFALSSLYPATVQLYRRAGYARAGARHEITVDPAAVRTGARGVFERVDAPSDDEALKALYRRFASSRNGFLDRGPYVWSRVLRPRKSATEVFRLGQEGYLALTHRMLDDGGEVLVRDLVVLDARAAAQALELLASYGSVAQKIRWWGAAPDLLTASLPERRHAIRTTDYWMLRICDVPRALELRGYGALDLDLELDVRDDTIPENQGRFVLSVRDGRGQVTAGGRGALRLDVRALAALYSGFLDVHTLVALGEAEGSSDELARADALFAGRPPAMSDYF